MKKQELVQVMVFLADIYPNFRYPVAKAEDNERMVNSWHFLLGEFDFREVLPVVKQLTLESSTFCPSAPMIAEAVASSKTTVLDSGEECWLVVEKETSYPKGGIGDKLDEAGRIALKRIGGIRVLGDIHPRTWPFTKKEYLALYRDAASEMHQENIKRISNGDEPLAIGDYEQEYKAIDYKNIKPGSIGQLLENGGA